MLQSETKAGKRAGPVCWRVSHIDHSNLPLSLSSVGSDSLFYQAEPLTRGGHTRSVRATLSVPPVDFSGVVLNSLHPSSLETWRASRLSAQELIIYLPMGSGGRGEPRENPDGMRVTRPED